MLQPPSNLPEGRRKISGAPGARRFGSDFQSERNIGTHLGAYKRVGGNAWHRTEFAHRNEIGKKPQLIFDHQRAPIRYAPQSPPPFASLDTLTVTPMAKKSDKTTSVCVGRGPTPCPR